MAQLAGISVTWYTWLEQGREISVSEQVLHSLARTLRLNEQEVCHIFDLAGMRVPAKVVDGKTTTAAMRRLVEALDPNPAYVLSPSWDILAWNRAEEGLLGELLRRPLADRNLIKMIFVESAMRRLMLDWSAQAKSIVDQYRACVGLAGTESHSARSAVLVAELKASSAEFRAMWEQHDVAGFASARWQFDHPRLGLLTLDYVKVSAMEDQAVKVFACLPADDATARLLPELAQDSPMVAARPLRADQIRARRDDEVLAVPSRSV